MRKSYVIQWKSSINGRAGKGTKLFEYEEASRLAEELNTSYPGIHHEPVEVESPPGPPTGINRAETEQEEVAPKVTNVPDFAFSA